MKKVTRVMAAIAAGAMALTVSACGGSSNANGAKVNSDKTANDSASCTNTVKKKGVQKVTVWAWYPAIEQVVDEIGRAHV